MLHSAGFLLRLAPSVPERRSPAEPIQTTGRRFGNVNPYEILLLLDPELAEERQTEIVTRIRELVESDGGAWLTHDAWGRRRLAYEIDRKGEGAYHLLTFDATPAALSEVSRVLKITDGVMRHLAVRRIEGSSTAAPPQVAVGGREYPETNECSIEGEEE
jgi:small subunit ribosomal protein S6